MVKYMALPLNEYLFAEIIIQLFIKLLLLAALFRHQLSCSAAPNGGHSLCAFLFQVRVIRMNSIYTVEETGNCVPSER
jgi:hypothetical protein